MSAFGFIEIKAFGNYFDLMITFTLPGRRNIVVLLLGVDINTWYLSRTHVIYLILLLENKIVVVQSSNIIQIFISM